MERLLHLFIIILLTNPIISFAQENFKVELNQGLPTLSLRQAERVDNLDALLDLYLVVENSYAPVQVSGKYWQEDGWIKYQPYTKLQEGFSFEARFYSETDTNRIKFTVPESENSQIPLSEVLEVYPVNGSVPSNILFFHVRFSQPMMETPEA